MKKKPQSSTAMNFQPENHINGDANNKGMDSGHQHPETDEESYRLSGENPLPSMDVNILKNYSQFFIELS